MSRYGLRGEFGDAFFTGTKSEVEKVMKAMITYGILERKLHIVYPEHHDFKLPEKLADKIDIELTNAIAEGRDYSNYLYDEAGYEVGTMSDYDKITYYRDIYDDEEYDSDEIIKANELYKSFLAEKVLLEEE